MTLKNIPNFIQILGILHCMYSELEYNIFGALVGPRKFAAPLPGKVIGRKMILKHAIKDTSCILRFENSSKLSFKILLLLTLPQQPLH